MYFQIGDVAGQAEFVTSSGSSLNPLPVFGWTSVQNAVRYELWVNDQSRGLNPIIQSSSIFDTAYAVSEPLAPGDYRAWVRAFDADGNTIGGWSQRVDYRIREAASKPDIWSPNATTDSGAPLIVWSQVSEAERYSVSFSYGPTGSTGSLPLTQHNVTENSLQLDHALDPGDYQVAVTAFNVSGDAIGSSVRRFVVESTSSTPVIYGPVGDELSSRPIFTWSTVTGASRYILWVNDLTNNVNRFILESNAPSSVFIPESTIPAGNYRAWVRGYNGATPVGGWSAAADFAVTESVGVPRITAPLPVTESSVPAITWNYITGAARYDVEISDVGAGGTLEILGDTTDTVFRPAQALQPGDYEIRVRSVDGVGGASPWGTFSLSIVAAESATFFSPLPASSTASSDVLFAWSAVRMAARYELWVNNVTTGQIKVIYQTALLSNSYTPAVALGAGDYRAWVRGIHADNTATAWSAGVDFTVAENERAMPGLLDDGLRLVPVSLQLDDDIHSQSDIRAAVPATDYRHSERTSQLPESRVSAAKQMSEDVEAEITRRQKGHAFDELFARLASRGSDFADELLDETDAALISAAE